MYKNKSINFCMMNKNSSFGQRKDREKNEHCFPHKNKPTKQQKSFFSTTKLRREKREENRPAVQISIFWNFGLAVSPISVSLLLIPGVLKLALCQFHLRRRVVSSAALFSSLAPHFFLQHRFHLPR